MKTVYTLLLFLLPFACWAQTITGTVKDTKNEPLEGVTVRVIGSDKLTFTNDKGEFKMTVSNPNAVIRFTATFAETLDVPLAGQKNLTVILKTRLNSLDEVQVIAYGTSTQRTTVGSISKVSAKDIEEQAVTNPLAALEGRVPGLLITATSGMPGSAFNVQIRGQNTLNPDRTANQFAPVDNPLFIIDGVPFAAQNTNLNQFASIVSPGAGAVYNNHYGGVSPFNSLNPADIESIEVLRDADATAIYGSRGGNGVILITTKKAKAGKTQFDLNVLDGVSVTGSTMPMMNLSQYLQMRKQAFANDGLTPNNVLYDPAFAPDLTVFDTTRYTNWKKVFYGNTARNLRVNAALSGGSANTQFHLGAGFNKDTYILPGDFADNRISFSANIHHTSENKRLTVDFSSSYSYDRNNSAADPRALSAITLEPDYPSPVDSKGNLNWTYNGIPLDGSYAAYNPFAYLKESYFTENSMLNSNLLVSYKIIDGLTFRTSLGYSSLLSQEYSGNPLAAQNPGYGPVATAQFGNNNYSTWIVEPQLEYRNSFKKAVYDLLVGTTFQKETNAQTQVEGTGYINDDLINAISGSATQTASDSYFDYRYTALFGRFNLRWDSKYIIDVTGRRDGSSRFGPGKQFGNFGSAGGAWLFGEERAVKDHLSFLSYGKLRATYGITGNDKIANYQYLSLWAPTAYNYSGTAGYLPQNLYNPNFGWATTKKLELGAELGFLKDRILFSAAWFRNRSGDQLITYQLPTQTGFGNVLENWNAIVQNTGIELTLQVSPFKSDRFTWNSSFNMTIPQNKLVSFPGLAQSPYSTTYVIGQSLTVQEKFRSAGVDPQTGLFQFYNAQGQITGSPVEGSTGKFNDFRNIGNLDPKFYGGWSNNFTWKRLHLDVFLEFRKQMGVNYLGQVYTFLPGTEVNQPAALLNAWTRPGQGTNIQRFSSQYGQAATEARYFEESTGAYGDASYIRFKTISLSYNLPAAWIRRLNITGLKLYASAQNLFTITDYKGNDPETQNFYGVPVLKTVTCGLQLTL